MYKRRDKVIYKDKIYDYGYLSAVEGKVVLYEVGANNMQDSFVVDLTEIKSVEKELPKIWLVLVYSNRSDIDELYSIKAFDTCYKAEDFVNRTTSVQRERYSYVIERLEVK